QDARARDQAPSLEGLINDEEFRGEGEGLNYALARYFCFYLQERELLGPYYRKFRSNASQDPQGIQTLCRVLAMDSPAEVEADFYAWLRTAKSSPHATVVSPRPRED